MASRATASVIRFFDTSWARSRTRLRKRFATRGVPRARLARRSAAPGSMATPSIAAERTTISRRSPAG